MSVSTRKYYKYKHVSEHCYKVNLISTGLGLYLPYILSALSQNTCDTVLIFLSAHSVFLTAERPAVKTPHVMT